MSSLTFLLQIFSELIFCLQNFNKIVNLLSATVSNTGLRGKSLFCQLSYYLPFCGRGKFFHLSESLNTVFDLYVE